MALPSLELFIQPQALRVSSSVHLWPCPRTLVEYPDHQAIMFRFYCQNSPLRCLATRFAASCSGTRPNLVGVVPLAYMERASSMAVISSESDSEPNMPYNEDRHEVRGLNGHHSEPIVTCTVEEFKEFERRRRIGLANKGKMPWNKGRKHSPETRARIRERTLQALKDLKVRKKMSESPRPRIHSAQSKEKISSSLRQLWAKRLQRKRATERLYSCWAESVAEAARRGGIDEEELNWDSYQKLKEEIASQQLQRAAEKAKEIELKMIRAEKRAQEKAKKMASQARKTMDLKQKALPRTKKRGRLSSRARNQKEKNDAASRDSNDKAKFANINGKKVADGTFNNQAGGMLYLQSALERLDIESVKKELCRSTVSLADQIQAAKRKRTEAIASGSAIRTSLGT